jgi:Fe-S-cluster containining protein
MENTREWLIAYMRRRDRLASKASDFHCDPDCTRPGCKNTDLQVPVSLVEIVAAARHRGESVSATFRCHYFLGLFYNDTDYCLRTVSLKLQKPCPFLADDLCSLYPVRPLPCILFPEYLVHRGTFGEQAKNEQFRDYLCMRRPLPISPERARVLATLGRMLERESLVTSFYLFGQSLCHLDFTDLIPELLSSGGAGADSTADPSPAPASHQVLEDFFQAHIAGLPPFAGVPEKIAVLETPEAQAQFLKCMQDERLYKKLRQQSDDRALVFRFTDGRLKPLRRSILPSEYKFYA